MSMGRILGVVCACVLVAPLAHADTETVHLADGSIFSGELVEKVPNDHVTIKLATGEVRRFAWSAIASPSSALAVGQAQIVVPQLPPLPPRPAHVRFTSDTTGALLMRVESIPVGLQGWSQTRESPVCYAPCSAEVDANAHYYVSGYGITPSTRFAIPEGNANVSVRAGSDALNVTGAILVTLGSLSFITGAVATPIAFADAKTAPLNGWETFGISALVGGAVFVLAGLPFIFAGRTRVAFGDMVVAKRRHWTPNGFVF